jgi:hypothetical protein
MASHSKNQKSNSGKRTAKEIHVPGQSSAAKPKPSAGSEGSWWNTLDNYFSRHLNAILVISVISSFLFGILLFDAKISTGGDDSHYIEMGNDFLKGRTFPSWHGPLYPIFLSVPMLVFGVNLIWLKLTSFIFIIAQLILFFHTFKSHISPTIFALVMLIVSVNSTILYFASQTYSEAMFMFLQSLTIFIFIRTYLATKDQEHIPFKQDALPWFIIGFFVFLTSLTRDIGIVMLLAAVLFLLLQKKFRASAVLVLSFSVFFFLFKLYKSLVWAQSASPDKIGEILAKNQYNRAMGTEDIAGMLHRFTLNARGYLSKHFMIGLGLHDPSTTDKSYFVTIIIALLLLVSLIYAFRRNKILLFVALYIGGSLAATFIALNQSWDQMRMVIIYIPMMLMLIAWGILQLSREKGFKYLGILLPFLLLLIFIKTLDLTLDRCKANQKMLRKNLSGNLYYGYTPDWQNFLRMSEWVSKNIPEHELVASRKHSMSYIYGKGRDFYPLYRFPTNPPEEYIRKLEQRTGELSVISNKLINATWPAELQWAIKKANVACVAEGNEIYGVYEFKGNDGAMAKQELNKLNVQPMTTDSLINRIRVSTQNCFAVSPDTLINNLKKNKVSYMIVASLRANPTMNTGNIINTMQRYLYFVEQKYPGIIRLTHQIGADAEEPAWLYQINYNIYGL